MKMILLLLTVLSLMGRAEVRAEEFPFGIETVGELVDGYRFSDVSVQAPEKIEVMVVSPEGHIVFPADVKYTAELLKIFYRKILQKIQDEGKGGDPVVEVIKLITPMSVNRMLVYPDLEAGEISGCAEYIGIEPQKFEKVVKEWSLRAKGMVEDGMPHKKVVTMLHGNTIKEFKITLNAEGTQLESISLSGTFVFTPPMANLGKQAILPELEGIEDAAHEKK